jgi:hypothetical protein
MKIYSAEGAKLACLEYADSPDDAALMGMSPETAYRFLTAEAVLMGGYVNCRYHDRSGEVLWVSRVQAMHLAGVAACYISSLALFTLAIGARRSHGTPRR